jgi:O-antigen/teichoic acid export membrane protein
VLLIYGENFLPVVPVLMVLAIYPFLAVMQVLIQKVLILFDRTKHIFFFGLGAVVLNIILNAWFIPLYNIVGAAVATIASYISWNIISYIYINRLLRRRGQCALNYNEQIKCVNGTKKKRMALYYL